MILELSLTELPAVRINAIQLGAIRTLRSITSRNLERAVIGEESRHFRNRKEEMKQRLMARGRTGFEEATAEDGRERLLLSLYLEYATRPDAGWLPAFDGPIAKSVLGTRGRDWHAGRRRQATQLFFTHFDKLQAAGLACLCILLVDAYDNLEQDGTGPVAKWRQHRRTVFAPQGHEGVARSAGPNEGLQELIDRFAIPGGRFVECLRQVFLLSALKTCPLGNEVTALGDIEAIKGERASASLVMGAAALQIMVQRVAREGGRKWIGEWPNWITRLGCDPRHGRATAEGSKWWGWATDDELRLAQQGVTGLTLRFFIEFLKRSLQGTAKEPQFALRARFLLALFEANKIESARLVLNWVAYQRLDRRYRDPWTIAHLSATTDETSMICLKCADDIFVIEGTHSFGLRMFHRKFPIPGFWERPKQTYQDKELRISPSDCPAFLRHDQGGNWVDNFFQYLRFRFRVEWDYIRV